MTIRLDIQCSQGEDFSTAFSALVGNSPVVPLFGASARMQWRKWPTMALVLDASTTNGLLRVNTDAGSIHLGVSGIALAAIPPGLYLYDIFVRSSFGQAVRLFHGDVRVYEQICITDYQDLPALGLPSLDFRYSQNYSIWAFRGRVSGGFTPLPPEPVVDIPSRDFTNSANYAMWSFVGVVDGPTVDTTPPLAPLSMDYRFGENYSMWMFRGRLMGGFTPLAQSSGGGSSGGSSVGTLDFSDPNNSGLVGVI